MYLQLKAVTGGICGPKIQGVPEIMDSCAKLTFQDSRNIRHHSFYIHYVVNLMVTRFFG